MPGLAPGERSSSFRWSGPASQYSQLRAANARDNALSLPH